MIEDRLEGIVRVEPISNENGDLRVLPGAKKTFAPTLDKYGNIKSGLTRDEVKNYESLLNLDLDEKFWASFRVVMTDSPKSFDLTIPEQRMQILFLRRHPDVLDIGEVKTPRTVYKVIDEEFIANRDAEKLDSKKTAYAYLDEMEAEDLRGFLTLFGIKTDKSSINVLKKRADEKLLENPKKFVEMYEDEDRKTRVFLKDLVRFEVLRMNKTHYYFGDIHLAENEELAITYLNEVDNQQTLIALKKELEEKKKLS